MKLRVYIVNLNRNSGLEIAGRVGQVYKKEA